MPAWGRDTEASRATSRSPATSVWVERRRWLARSTLRLSCLWVRPSREASVTDSTSPKLVASVARVDGQIRGEGWSASMPSMALKRSLEATMEET